jgi:hypothetical protein
MSDCFIKVDKSGTSLAYCTCGWRQLASTEEMAWMLGALHQTRSGTVRGNAAHVMDNRRLRAKAGDSDV